MKYSKAIPQKLQGYFETNMQEYFETYSLNIWKIFTLKMVPRLGFVGDRRELSDKNIGD